MPTNEAQARNASAMSVCRSLRSITLLNPRQARSMPHAPGWIRTSDPRLRRSPERLRLFAAVRISCLDRRFPPLRASRRLRLSPGVALPSRCPRGLLLCTESALIGRPPTPEGAPKESPSQAALVAVEVGEADGIVVHNVDRLARELHVQEAALDRAWRAGGSVFETFDGEIPRDDPNDPQRTFLRQVLGAAAQLERGLIAARLRRGRRRKRERGGYAGGPTVPFGWQVEGEGREAVLVPEPEGQRVASQVVAFRAAGMTLAAIAEWLNAEGVPTQRGGRWHITSVRRLIARIES